jgi:hypothetical protein
VNDQEAAKTITGKQVALGFGLGMIFHLILLLVIPLEGLLGAVRIGSDSVAVAAIIAALNPGATQFLYNSPLVIYLKRRGRAGMARGVLIAMGLTILLNGLCWVAIETGKFRIGG